MEVRVEQAPAVT